MSIRIRRAGMYTTVQDLGRYGYRGGGVPVSGAMDQFALRAANVLVGNASGAAALELTMVGPELEFLEAVMFAICGAEMEPRINGQKVPAWRPIIAQKGQFLELSRALDGCRSYIALAGGIVIPPVMGSKSTYARARVGGFAGRALRSGDILQAGRSGFNLDSMVRSWSSGKRRTKPNLVMTDVRQSVLTEDVHGVQNCSVGWAAAPWYVSPAIRPAYREKPELRIIRGRESKCFKQECMDGFLSTSYRVSPQSDRMGYRLQGEQLELVQPLEMITEAAAPGTIQAPPDGQPILLMSDCQTTGGYPRIAHVISADLPLAAQLKPGSMIRFREVTLREAHEQLLLREMDLRLLQAGVRGRMAEL